MSKQQGFTLIELLVVMGIISILATITFSQYTSAQVKARDVQRKNDMNTLIKSLVFFTNDYKKLYGQIMTAPTDDLNYKIRDTSDQSMVGSDGYVYIATLPKEKRELTTNPDTTLHINQYCYVEDIASQKFAVFASLENRKDGDCRLYQPSLPSVAGTCGAGKYYNYALLSSNSRISDFVTLGVGATVPKCN